METKISSEHPDVNSERRNEIYYQLRWERLRGSGFCGQDQEFILGHVDLKVFTRHPSSDVK